MDGWMTGVGWRETECLLIVFSLWTYCVGVVATTAVYAYGVCVWVCVCSGTAAMQGHLLVSYQGDEWWTVAESSTSLFPWTPSYLLQALRVCVPVWVCVRACVCVYRTQTSHTLLTPHCVTHWNRAVRLPVKTIINTKYRIFRNWLAACLFSPYVVHKL